jgi:hypothetical protein
MKYIKPCRYKKSSLQTEITKTHRLHTIPRKHFVLWTIQVLRIRWYNSLICTHAHSSHHGFSQSRKCSSTPCKTIIGSHAAGRNCRLICKLTVCSSLTVFFWMWITRNLVILTKNLWHHVSKRDHLHLSWIKSYLLCHFYISYFMLSSIFISKETRAIFIFIYYHFNCLTREK